MAKLKHKNLRRRIIATCREMNAARINQGTSGNVSARTEEGFLVTASGIAYDEMEPEHVVEMDLDQGYRGDVLPSTEWRMHHDIYRARPEAGAIVHVHSIHATALSCLRKEVPAFHYMIGVTGGASLRVTDYAEFGTQALSDAMLKAMKDRRACLLANHGQIVFGPTLAKALWLAIEVETLCHQYLAALQAGEPIVLSDEQMKPVLARFKSYGKQPRDLAKGESLTVLAPKRRDGESTKKMRRKV